MSSVKWKSFCFNRLMAQRFYFRGKRRRSWDCGGKFSSQAAAGIQLIQTHRNLSPPYYPVFLAEFPKWMKSSTLLESCFSSAGRFCKVSHLTASVSLLLSSGFLAFEAAHMEHPSPFQLQAPYYLFAPYSVFTPPAQKKKKKSFFLLLCLGLQVDSPAVLGHPCFIQPTSFIDSSVTQCRHCTAVPSCTGVEMCSCFSQLNVQ